MTVGGSAKAAFGGGQFVASRPNVRPIKIPDDSPGILIQTNPNKLAGSRGAAAGVAVWGDGRTGGGGELMSDYRGFQLTAKLAGEKWGVHHADAPVNPSHCNS